MLGDESSRGEGAIGSIDSLVPEALLSRSKKILFVTHLAIGDFTYLQNCFSAFKKKYPHIKIDLFIDEVRRTRLFWDWKHLKKYSLIDWISEASTQDGSKKLFNKVYSGTYSWRRFKNSFQEAKCEEYPIVVSLCVLRMKWYAKIARRISKKGFVVGLADKKYGDRGFRCFDACIDLSGFEESAPKVFFKGGQKKVDSSSRVVPHVSQKFQRWFKRFFDLSFSHEDKLPFIQIPKKWISYGKLCFVKWGITQEGAKKVVFLNIFAKNVSRCWNLDKMVQLINTLREDESFSDAYFIVNVEPKFYDAVKAFLGNFCLNRVVLFTANTNFFQLPAVISLCDFVISVDTSIVHLASALRVPVISLMRKKNAEWTPYFKDNSVAVFGAKRSSWVEDICYKDVVKEVCDFSSTRDSLL